MVKMAGDRLPFVIAILIVQLAVYGDALLDGCGGKITTDAEYIQSPNWPSTYSSNLNCTWIVTAPSDYYISLTVERFKLESSQLCRADYLTIIGVETSVGSYCGSSLEGSNALRSTGNHILLNFVTDGSGNYEGFVIKLQFKPEPNCDGGDDFCSNGGICNGINTCECSGSWTGYRCFYPLIPSLPEDNITPTGVLRTSSPTCSLYGLGRVTTFDGMSYQFDGTCRYVVAKAMGSFEILIRRTDGCGLGSISCISEIAVDGASGNFLTIASDGTLLIEGGVPTLPVTKAGVTVSQTPTHFIVLLDNDRMMVDKSTFALHLNFDPSSAGKLSGLCGNFNGNPDDDYQGFADQMSFIATWHRNIDGVTCSPWLSSSNTTCERPLNAIVPLVCAVLLTKPFEECRHGLSAQSFYQQCYADVCQCDLTKSQDCLCPVVAEYARTCARAGFDVGSWRTPTSCGVTCPGNQVYSECSCPSNCGSVSGSCLDDCNDGCQCDSGLHWNGTWCVSQSQCPCTLAGKTYSPGDVITQGCETCVCTNSMWDCSKTNCGATAIAYGFSHFLSLDGTWFNFPGAGCEYLFAEDFVGQSFVVYITMESCGLNSAFSCIKNVKLIHNYDQYSYYVLLSRNGDVRLQNDVQAVLPASNGQIQVYRLSNNYIEATILSLNVTALWNDGSLSLSIPPTYLGKIRGLAGTYNHVTTDDLLSKSGEQASSLVFGNSWKYPDSCPDVQTNTSQPHACIANPSLAPAAETECSVIKGDLFWDCRQHVAHEEFYSNCLASVCACEMGTDCKCSAIAAYAQECLNKGVVVPWRSDVFCDLSCPVGHVSQPSTTRCRQTCRGITDLEYCSPERKVQGCNCPDGLYLSDDDSCVPRSECPCYVNQEWLPLDHMTFPDNTRSCICTGGKNICSGTKGSISSGDGESCWNDDMEYVDCNNLNPGQKGSECARTCNFLNQTCPETSCTSGCVCKNGKVRLGQSCIEESECPCSLSGSFYPVGSVITEACREMTCGESSTWVTNDARCYAQCNLAGGKFYQTFDGRQYDFDGPCEYLLASDACGADAPWLDSSSIEFGFRVSVKVHRCSGSTQAICSTSVRIVVGKYEVILGGHFGSHQSVISSREDNVDLADVTITISSFRGNYVIVDSSNGLRVIWDQKATVYVQLEGDLHTSSTCGLCGDNDGDASNDMKKQSNEITTSPVELGNSWKMSSQCSDINEPNEIDCGSRQAWARKQCMVIYTTFWPCHSKVSPTAYYDKCVEESCSCDAGGDCDCLCTSVADYAYACGEYGIAIEWRTPEFCPIMCEGYNTYDDCLWKYDPCAPPCPKICCEQCLEGCYEGCYPECLNGTMFKPSTGKCVPPPECDCDIISEEKCPEDYIKMCHWTDWENNNYPSMLKGGEFETIKKVDEVGEETCNIINDISCRNAKDHHEPLQNHVTCDKSQGLTCHISDQVPPICHDYEIRLECCYCEHICETVVCDPEPTCQPYERLESTEGKCCPNYTCKCVGCYHNYELKQPGDKWEENCTESECVDDGAGCYKVVSSKIGCAPNEKTCPHYAKQVVTQDPDDCCPGVECVCLPQYSPDLIIECEFPHIPYTKPLGNDTLGCVEHSCECPDVDVNSQLCLEEPDCSAVGCSLNITTECGCILEGHCYCDPTTCPQPPVCQACEELTSTPAGEVGYPDQRCDHNNCCAHYECKTKPCSSNETYCEDYEIKVLAPDSDPCCPTYLCVCDVCPELPHNCSNLEDVVPVPANPCCMENSCKCVRCEDNGMIFEMGDIWNSTQDPQCISMTCMHRNSSNQCPSVEIYQNKRDQCPVHSPPNCEKFEKIEMVPMNECCDKPICVCDDTKCPEPPTCIGGTTPLYDSENSDHCCNVSCCQDVCEDDGHIHLDGDIWTTGCLRKQCSCTGCQTCTIVPLEQCPDPFPEPDCPDDMAPTVLPENQADCCPVKNCTCVKTQLPDCKPPLILTFSDSGCPLNCICPPSLDYCNYTEPNCKNFPGCRYEIIVQDECECVLEDECQCNPDLCPLPPICDSCSTLTSHKAPLNNNTCENCCHVYQCVPITCNPDYNVLPAPPGYKIVPDGCCPNITCAACFLDDGTIKDPGERWTEYVDGCGVTYVCSSNRYPDSLCHIVEKEFDPRDHCKAESEYHCSDDKMLEEVASTDPCCKNYSCICKDAPDKPVCLHPGEILSKLVQTKCYEEWECICSKDEQYLQLHCPAYNQSLADLTPEKYIKVTEKPPTDDDPCCPDYEVVCRVCPVPGVSCPPGHSAKIVLINGTECNCTTAICECNTCPRNGTYYGPGSLLHGKEDGCATTESCKEKRGDDGCYIWEQIYDEATTCTSLNDYETAKCTQYEMAILKQKPENTCCDVYECVCDLSQCTEPTTPPTVDEFHELVPYTEAENPNQKCCPLWHVKCKGCIVVVNDIEYSGSGSGSSAYTILKYPGEKWNETVGDCHVVKICSDKQGADTCYIVDEIYDEKDHCLSEEQWANKHCTNDGEIVVKIDSTGHCCQKFDCICDPSLTPAPPTCSRPGEIPDQPYTDGCIPKQVCICANDSELYKQVCPNYQSVSSSCSPPKEVVEYPSIDPVHGPCCPTYDCVCDYDQCTNYNETCTDIEDPIQVDVNACCKEGSCLCVRCKDDGSLYEVGQIWNSTTDPHCTTMTCMHRNPEDPCPEVELYQNKRDQCPPLVCGKHETKYYPDGQCCESCKCIEPPPCDAEPSCNAGQTLVDDTPNSSDCCNASCCRDRCEDGGIFYDNGDVWKSGCSRKTCSCSGCGPCTIVPLAQCPDQVTPICASGNKPVEVENPDDPCCPILECQCVCVVYGDPHYVSFDNKYFPFMGECHYTLVTYRDSDRLHIYSDNVECARVGDAPLTCLKKVFVEWDGTLIELFYDSPTSLPHAVLVNHARLTLPWTNDKIDIKYEGSSIALTIPEINLRLEYSVAFIPSTIIYIPASTMFNKTVGLCGTCSNDTRDDFECEGKQIEDATDFGNCWLVDHVVDVECICDPKVNESCRTCDYYVKHNLTLPENCRNCTHDVCDILDSDLFAECHETLDPTSYIDACNHDAKAWGNCSVCNSSAVHTYADLCMDKLNVCIDWQKEHNCTVDCSTGGKVYQSCVDQCDATKTCKDYAYSCHSDKKVSGCFCPPGTVFSTAEEKCVDIACCNCEPDPVCPPLMHATVVPGEEGKCCPKMNCTCVPIEKPECTPPFVIKYTINGTCPVPSCVCPYPLDYCNPDLVNCTNLLGCRHQVIKQDECGCVLDADCVCNPDLCPMPPICGNCFQLKSHKLPLNNDTCENCCEVYQCVPVTCDPFYNATNLPDGYKLVQNGCCADIECNACFLDDGTFYPPGVFWNETVDDCVVKMVCGNSRYNDTEQCHIGEVVHNSKDDCPSEDDWAAKHCLEEGQIVEKVNSTGFCCQQFRCVCDKALTPAPPFCTYPGQTTGPTYQDGCVPKQNCVCVNDSDIYKLQCPSYSIASFGCYPPKEVIELESLAGYGPCCPDYDCVCSPCPTEPAVTCPPYFKVDVVKGECCSTTVCVCDACRDEVGDYHAIGSQWDGLDEQGCEARFECLANGDKLYDGCLVPVNVTKPCSVIDKCDEYHELAFNKTASDLDGCCSVYNCVCRQCPADHESNCGDDPPDQHHDRIPDPTNPNQKCCPSCVFNCTVCDFGDGQVHVPGDVWNTTDAGGCVSTHTCTGTRLSGDPYACFAHESHDPRDDCTTLDRFEELNCSEFEHAELVSYASGADPDACCDEYECVCNDCEHTTEIGDTRCYKWENQSLADNPNQKCCPLYYPVCVSCKLQDNTTCIFPGESATVTGDDGCPIIYYCSNKKLSGSSNPATCYELDVSYNPKDHCMTRATYENKFCKVPYEEAVEVAYGGSGDGPDPDPCCPEFTCQCKDNSSLSTICHPWDKNDFSCPDHRYDVVHKSTIDCCPVFGCECPYCPPVSKNCTYPTWIREVRDDHVHPPECECYNPTCVCDKTKCPDHYPQPSCNETYYDRVVVDEEYYEECCPKAECVCRENREGCYEETGPESCSIFEDRIETTPSSQCCPRSFICICKNITELEVLCPENYNGTVPPGWEIKRTDELTSTIHTCCDPFTPVCTHCVLENNVTKKPGETWYEKDGDCDIEWLCSDILLPDTCHKPVVNRNESESCTTKDEYEALVCTIPGQVAVEIPVSGQCCNDFKCVCDYYTTVAPPFCSKPGQVPGPVQRFDCYETQDCVCVNDSAVYEQQCPNYSITESGCDINTHEVVELPEIHPTYGPCCPKYDCVCRPCATQSPPTCPPGFKVQEDSDSCNCPSYSCVCDSCVAEDGSRYELGQTWQAVNASGCHISYQCLATGAQDADGCYIPTASPLPCPTESPCAAHETKQEITWPGDSDPNSCCTERECVCSKCILDDGSLMDPGTVKIVTGDDDCQVTYFCTTYRIDDDPKACYKIKVSLHNATCLTEKEYEELYCTIDGQVAEATKIDGVCCLHFTCVCDYYTTVPPPFCSKPGQIPGPEQKFDCYKTQDCVCVNDSAVYEQQCPNYSITESSCDSDTHEVVELPEIHPTYGPCCPKYDCVCRPCVTQSPPTCPPGFKVQEDSDSCNCPSYSCVCDSCVAEDGSRYELGQTWQAVNASGCHISYQCQETAKTDPAGCYVPSETVLPCPSEPPCEAWEIKQAIVYGPNETDPNSCCTEHECICAYCVLDDGSLLAPGDTKNVIGADGCTITYTCTSNRLGDDPKACFESHSFSHAIYCQNITDFERANCHTPYQKAVERVYASGADPDLCCAEFQCVCWDVDASSKDVCPSTEEAEAKCSEIGREEPTYTVVPNTANCCFEPNCPCLTGDQLDDVCPNSDLVCGVGEYLDRLFKKDVCCPEYSCVCSKCPPGHQPTPERPLEDYEEYANKTLTENPLQKCCPELKIVCKADQSGCPLASCPDWSTVYNLPGETDPATNDCCPKQVCKCDDVCLLPNGTAVPIGTTWKVDVGDGCKVTWNCTDKRDYGGGGGGGKHELEYCYAAEVVHDPSQSCLSQTQFEDMYCSDYQQAAPYPFDQLPCCEDYHCVCKDQAMLERLCANHTITCGVNMHPEEVGKVNGTSYCCPLEECRCDDDSILETACDQWETETCPLGYQRITTQERNNVTGPCCPEYRCDCLDYTGLSQVCPQWNFTCPLGSKRVRTNTECCPEYECQCESCVLGGAVYPVNTTITMPDNHCLVGECLIDEDTHCPAISTSDKYDCPDFDEQKCRDRGGVVFGDDATNGCCKNCSVVTNPCEVDVQQRRLEAVINGAKCWTTTDVEVSFCSGSCPTIHQIDPVSGTMSGECQCCLPGITSTRDRQMDCEDLTSRAFVQTVIMSCACAETSCDSPQTTSAPSGSGGFE